MAKHNATAWLYRGKIVPFGEEDEELKSILAKRGVEAPTVRVYNYQGKKYTAETLAEAPEEFIQELRRRGVRTPETEALPAAKVADIAGVGPEMEAALREAGYKSVASIARASAEDLQGVSGVGPKTAPKLIAAAQNLHGFSANAPDAQDAGSVAGKAPGGASGGGSA